MATSHVNLVTRPPLTLADVAVPRAGALRDALLVVGFIVVNALSAQVAIPLPFTPVPVTGQTFSVRLTGGLLGARLGLLTMLGYLLAGSLSLPVFAAGKAGPGVLLGPTAGYLAGFVVSAWLMGRFAERGWDRRFGRGLAAMLLASLPIYGLGLVGLWLWQPMPLGTLLAKGLWPFLPGDVLKLLLAAGVLTSGWRVVARLRRV
ncbi:MAG TPA: biotin transporter BioY [Methylomirabilota bacterium]|nr:biotin transporter BioY [Methylomirabilota bacterium]